MFSLWQICTESVEETADLDTIIIVSLAEHGVSLYTEAAGAFDWITCQTRTHQNIL